MLGFVATVYVTVDPWQITPVLVVLIEPRLGGGQSIVKVTVSVTELVLQAPRPLTVNVSTSSILHVFVVEL